MSINKAQGQSLKKLGLYLPQPVFSHGQLYVGLSRATNAKNIKVLLNESNNGTTKNVVYKNVLF
jgi:hypothetical protein